MESAPWQGYVVLGASTRFGLKLRAVLYPFRPLFANTNWNDPAVFSAPCPR
jgi:hypothetical protein